MALDVPPPCPVCDSSKIRESHRRNLLEKLPMIVFLRPYRCKECGDRFWRFALTKATSKMSDAGFEPKRYRDEYHERFLAVVDEKAKGHEIASPPPEADRRDRVIDIMAALKKSLATVKPRQQKRPPQK